MSRFSTNAHVLQRIDETLGIAACRALTILRRIGDFLSSQETGRSPVTSILFIKLAEQGSTVLAHEAIRQAVHKVGAENVYFLLFEENRFILDLLELVPPENVLAVRTRSPVEMVTSCLALLLQIRKLRLDACIDMEFFARSTAALAWLSGARNRVGFHAYFGEGPYRGDLLTHRVLYNPHIHTSSTFTSLVQALDVPSEDLPTFAVTPAPSTAPPLFNPEPEECREVRRMLRSLAPEGFGGLVLLNANASDLLPFRRWHEGNYVELAHLLLEEFPEMAVAFTGSPDEAAKVGAFVADVGSARCFSLAGRTTLRQLLVAYELADVLVTNDSGPAHFATLTSIDVVTLFGPETPLLFGAPSPRNHVIWAGIACSPCVNALNNRRSACRNNVCMKMIRVEEVFQTVCSVYRQRKTSDPQTPRRVELEPMLN